MAINETIQNDIYAIAKQTAKNTNTIKTSSLQRQNSVTEMFGVEYQRQGDGGSPATFYIAISKNMTYINLFQFKLIIDSFITTVSSGGLQEVSVNIDKTSLKTSNNSITPNPHTHTVQPHTHNVVSGISKVMSTSNNFKVMIEGIDITKYLKLQMNGKWINGNGIYPDDDMEDGSFFDIIQVASDMIAMGDTAGANKILNYGYKKLEIYSDTPFNCILNLYLRYSITNR